MGGELVRKFQDVSESSCCEFTANFVVRITNDINQMWNKQFSDQLIFVLQSFNCKSVMLDEFEAYGVNPTQKWQPCYQLERADPRIFVDQLATWLFFKEQARDSAYSIYMGKKVKTDYMSWILFNKKNFRLCVPPRSWSITISDCSSYQGAFKAVCLNHHIKKFK